MLSTDRRIGMAMGPIPFSAIDRFATRFGLDQREFEELEAAIGQIDGHVRSKSSAGKPDAPDPPKRRAR